MKLLIVTQAVDLDDPVLGFFHRWIVEFARHFERITVICLREGAHDLPQNVKVLSLGKERAVNSEPQLNKQVQRGRQKTVNRKIHYAVRFWQYIWRLRGEYDVVFVHMNPEYMLLGGLLWRIWRKKTILWYVHRRDSLVLRAAVLLAHRVATSAQGSIASRSDKIAVVGHGIDTEIFTGAFRPLDRNVLRIVTVGRISPIKSLETIVNATARLRDSGVNASLDIVGPTVYEGDVRYKSEIETLILQKKLSNHVIILPAVPNSTMAELYRAYDIAVNACPTGGIDKAVLEAMAAGKPVFVSNESFREYFDELANDLVFTFEDHTDLAEKIKALLLRNDVSNVQEKLRALARERADIGRLVPAIMQLYGTDR